jgi:hypothetical protein
MSVWETGIRWCASSRAVILDSGNLVFMDSDNGRVVWENFENSADPWLSYENQSQPSWTDGSAQYAIDDGPARVIRVVSFSFESTNLCIGLHICEISNL